MTSDELRRLLAEATPGPWRQSREDLARILGPDAGNYLGSTRHLGATASADAALIVALRNEAPALLDRLEALTEALRHIAYLGSSVPLPMQPEDFYRIQLYEAIGTAARALAQLDAGAPEKGESRG